MFGFVLFYYLGKRFRNEESEIDCTVYWKLINRDDCRGDKEKKGITAILFHFKSNLLSYCD